MPVTSIDEARQKRDDAITVAEAQLAVDKAAWEAANVLVSSDIQAAAAVRDVVYLPGTQDYVTSKQTFLSDRAAAEVTYLAARAARDAALQAARDQYDVDVAGLRRP